MYAFSWSCKARLGADSLTFAFSRAMLNAQICVIFSNPTELGWLPVCGHYIHPAAKAHICNPQGHAQRADHGVGVCGCEACGALRCPWHSIEDPQVKYSQWFIGGFLDGLLKLISVHVPLTHSVLNPGFCSPNPFLPPGVQLT